MRKYFNSAMLNAGCDFFHAEEFMGHSLPATQNHYYQADVDGLKEYYKKFVPYLTIQKELDVSEGAAYKDIKNENDILRAEAAHLSVERDEIEVLKGKIDLLGIIVETQKLMLAPLEMQALEEQSNTKKAVRVRGRSKL